MIRITKKIRSYSVASAGEVRAAPAQEGGGQGGDAGRLRFDVVPVPAEESMRFRSRPDDPVGHDARVYLIESPEGSFGVTVVHASDREPFEVWLQGDALPRGLDAVAMNLSLDMRSVDRAYLLRKIEALKKVDGIPFVLLCPDGVERRMKGAIEAFATVLEHRLRELGCFGEDRLAVTPMIDAMLSRREPKATDEGALAWNAPVANPTTGDRFEIFLKEADRPDGQRVPVSVWFSGRFPPSFAGIQKLLSIDMRIVDPYWIGRKLRQLSTVHELNGDFWCQIPGAGGKSKVYPSTLAYVADLIVSRYVNLGLLDRSGNPVKNGGAVQLALFRDQPTKKPQASLRNGLDCPACGSTAAVVLLDGCFTCTQCGHSKCG